MSVLLLVVDSLRCSSLALDGQRAGAGERASASRAGARALGRVGAGVRAA